MKRKKKKCKEQSVKITGIDITDDTLTARGGLNLFVRYLNSMFYGKGVGHHRGSSGLNMKKITQLILPSETYTPKLPVKPY